jgi:hypothetical protein
MAGSTSYVTPTGKPPPGAPTETSIRLVPILATPVAITVMPWPNGIVLAAVAAPWVPVTLRPTETGTWNNQLVSALENGFQLVVAGVNHDLNNEGTPVSITSTLDKPGPTSTATDGASTATGTSAKATSSTTGTPAQPTTTLPTPMASTISASGAPKSSGPSHVSSGLGAGPIAGIAIGCLVAGALLAGILFWFCWRRKKSPKSQYAHADTYALASQEKGFSAKAIPLAGAGHTATGLGGGLPQPLEDKAITGDISKISNAIKNHVQSYYHTSRISPGLIDYDDLHALGPNLPISVGTLTTLMGNAATREIALRFIIAWVVVSRLQPSKDPAKSLLPSEVAQCYQTISTGDRGFQGTLLIERANVQLLTST